MTKPVGGRGKKAPYETQQMRVPVPIKDRVNKLITKFRDGTLELDENLVSNTESLSEIKALQDEIQNLKTALESNETEKQNLNTALQDANQRINNLSSALISAQSEIQNLNATLAASKLEIQNLSKTLEELRGDQLNSGSKEIKIGDRMKEREFVRFFDVGERVFRNPREKRGEKTVQIPKWGKLITLEHHSEKGQGKTTFHYWTITDIKEENTELSNNEIPEQLSISASALI
jgi:flagellar biosynthesis chaperone FliJ